MNCKLAMLGCLVRMLVFASNTYPTVPVANPKLR